MEKLELDLDVGQQQEQGDVKERPQLSAQEERRLKIQRVRSLVHASHCRDSTCQLASCARMKRGLKHTITYPDGCQICQKLLYLCCYHAKDCLERECVVPFCRHVKHKLRQRQQQSMQPPPQMPGQPNAMMPGVQQQFPQMQPGQQGMQNPMQQMPIVSQATVSQQNQAVCGGDASASGQSGRDEGDTVDRADNEDQDVSTVPGDADDAPAEPGPSGENNERVDYEALAIPGTSGESTSRNTGIVHTVDSSDEDSAPPPRVYHSTPERSNQCPPDPNTMADWITCTVYDGIVKTAILGYPCSEQASWERDAVQVGEINEEANSLYGAELVCGNHARQSENGADVEVRVYQPTMSSANMVVGDIISGDDLTVNVRRAIGEAIVAAQAVRCQRDLIVENRNLRERQDMEARASETADRAHAQKKLPAVEIDEDKEEDDDEEESLDATVVDTEEVRKRRIEKYSQKDGPRDPKIPKKDDDDDEDANDSTTVTMRTSGN